MASLQPPAAIVTPAAMEHAEDSDADLKDADTAVSDAQFALALALQAPPAPPGQMPPLQAAHSSATAAGPMAAFGKIRPVRSGTAPYDVSEEATQVAALAGALLAAGSGTPASVRPPLGGSLPGPALVQA